MHKYNKQFKALQDTFKHQLILDIYQVNFDYLGLNLLNKLYGILALQ